MSAVAHTPTGSSGSAAAGPKAGPALRSSRGGASHWLQPALAVLLVVSLLGVPFWVVIATAGKTLTEAQRPNMAPPSDWGQLLTNISTVITQGQMLSALGGTLLVTVPSVVLVLLLSAAASWVLARRSNRLMAVLYAVAISGLVLPPAVVTIVLTLQYLGIAGTAGGMIGVYVGMYLSTAIFFMTGFIRTIPVELEEAARVDGAKPARVFFGIIMPLLGPTISTATILVTLFIWNDVFYALFVVGGRLDTLPLNLFQVASAGLYLNNWHLIFTYVILMSLPLLVVFIVMQRRIISGVTSGAVK